MKPDAIFRKVADQEGRAFYCPREAVGRGDRAVESMADVCVETEVVERYSGNIRVDRS
jgi:hypothetical protein